jgi:hypothetical protein
LISLEAKISNEKAGANIPYRKESNTNTKEIPNN